MQVWATGERAASVRNEAGEAIAMPTQPWPRPRANALIEARGIYRMANGTAGLILQVAALQLADQAIGIVPDPFAMDDEPNTNFKEEEDETKTRTSPVMRGREGFRSVHGDCEGCAFSEWLL